MFSPDNYKTFAYRSEWHQYVSTVEGGCKMGCIQMTLWPITVNGSIIVYMSDILKGLQSFQTINSYNQQMEDGTVYSRNILSLVNKWKRCDDLLVLKRILT